MCKVLQYFGKWCNYSAVTVKSLNSYRMIMNCTKGDIPLSDNKSKKCRESWQGFAWSWG